MLTERGTGLLGGAVALYVASRLFGIAELQLAAVAAVGLVLAAAAFTWSTSTSISVSRLVRPARLHFDAEAVVELTIRNVGRLPTATMEVRDEVPLALTDGGAATVRPLAPGARVVVDTPLRGRQRGRFQVGPLKVRLRDPFRLVARDVQVPGSVEVVVYPPVWFLPPGLPLGGVQAAGGEGPPRPLASGDERTTVRDYVRGDDLRTVHWPSTAHRGKLMVRQAETPQDPRAVVLLDVREDRHHGHGPTASIETAVAAAASVAYHLVDRGRGVIIADGTLQSPRARPAEGWLEHLAATQPTAVDTAGLLQMLAHGALGDGALLAVVTVPDPSDLRELVRAGRAFTSRSALLVDADRHASGVLRTGRPRGEVDATADRLRAAGWRVTVLGSGDRLEDRWRELMVDRRLVVTRGSR